MTHQEALNKINQIMLRENLTWQARKELLAELVLNPDKDVNDL